jgi:hypothetical protein
MADDGPRFARANTENAHDVDAPGGAPPRRQGRQAGYPAKLEFGAADQRLRRALSRLARDPDPEARTLGRQLAEQAVSVLQGLAGQAEEASTAHRRMQAEAERLRRSLDARLAQAGRRRQRAP